MTDPISKDSINVIKALENTIDDATLKQLEKVKTLVTTLNKESEILRHYLILGMVKNALGVKDE